ncbi:MAG: ABC transporter substrate-binding protein [Rhodoferax sp.]|nr:ABC transporter substrate-binding protein [Rhodoferax sp.]
MKLKSTVLALLTAGAALASLPASAAEYTIASIKALTGPLAFVGVPEANAVKMAIDELNAANYLGAGNTLKLVSNDDQNDRAQITTLLTRAAKVDNALIVLGGANSVLMIAIAPLLNDLQIPMFATAQTAAPLAASKWYLKVTASSELQVAPLAKYAVEKVKPQRLAAIWGRDNDGHINNMKAFMGPLAAAGIKPVAEETILIGDTDFGALATKIAAAKPDAIWLGANAAQAANLVIQLKQAGVSPNVTMFGTAGLGVDYLKIGGKAVENTYFAIDFNDQSTAPMNVKFRENYKKRYNTEPDNWAAVGYSEALLAARAIKDSMPNPTREKVLEAVMKLKDADVVLGNGKWSQKADRIPEYGPAVMVIKNGKPTPTN